MKLGGVGAPTGFEPATSYSVVSALPLSYGALRLELHDQEVDGLGEEEPLTDQLGRRVEEPFGALLSVRAVECLLDLIVRRHCTSRLPHSAQGEAALRECNALTSGWSLSPIRPATPTKMWTGLGSTVGLVPLRDPASGLDDLSSVLPRNTIPSNGPVILLPSGVLMPTREV